MEQTVKTSQYQARMQKAGAGRNRQEHDKALVAEARALLEKGDRMMEAEVNDVRQRLGIVPDMLSMSYIAEAYFGKSRTWLYQRINGNKVNGKPAFFTRSERKQLQDALRDIGEKLSAITLV